VDRAGGEERAAPDDPDDQAGGDGEQAIAGDERAEARQRTATARCSARAETGHANRPPPGPPP